VAEVTHLAAGGLELPPVVELDAGDLALTADEMDRLRAAAGVSLNVLLGDDDDLDNLPQKQRALVWLALRRQGYDPAWEACGAVQLRRVQVTVDPTVGG
jgi:hypothetical protein